MCVAHRPDPLAGPDSSWSGGSTKAATPIHCQTLYHHAFPPPPSGRGGRSVRRVRLGPDLKVEEVPCVSLYLSSRHSP